MKWISNNGRTYYLWQMDIGHIQNCIIKIHEKMNQCKYLNLGEFVLFNYTGKEWIDAFKRELNCRRLSSKHYDRTENYIN
jgi:hypothetical protein